MIATIFILMALNLTSFMLSILFIFFSTTFEMIKKHKTKPKKINNKKKSVHNPFTQPKEDPISVITPF